jgi:hypothetical protein
MQVHTNKGSREKQPGRKSGSNQAEMGLGRPAWANRPSPLRARFDAPFALGVRLFIASATYCLPFLLKKEHRCIPRVVVHHNKDVPLPTRRSHTSWANKVHMEQLTWTLSHHIGERRLRRGDHLGMPTRRTNQLFLKLQPWQSSDQIEFTQVRQKIKAEVTQLPMPPPQLTQRTSQEKCSTPED